MATPPRESSTIRWPKPRNECPRLTTHPFPSFPKPPQPLGCSPTTPMPTPGPLGFRWQQRAIPSHPTGRLPRDPSTPPPIPAPRPHGSPAFSPVFSPFTGFLFLTPWLWFAGKPISQYFYIHWDPRLPVLKAPWGGPADRDPPQVRFRWGGGSHNGAPRDNHRKPAGRAGG